MLREHQRIGNNDVLASPCCEYNDFRDVFRGKRFAVSVRTPVEMNKSVIAIETRNERRKGERERGGFPYA